MTSTAEIAVWLTNIKPWAMNPRPISTATQSAMNTATAMVISPVPNTACTPAPRPMPSVTPMII
jgi:hypothetical protein